MAYKGKPDPNCENVIRFENIPFLPKNVFGNLFFSKDFCIPLGEAYHYINFSVSSV